jgi:hypothetical protein
MRLGAYIFILGSQLREACITDADARAFSAAAKSENQIFPPVLDDSVNVPR